jgi:DNA-binding NtrC family response regulator
MAEKESNNKDKIKLLLIDDEEGYLNILCKRMRRRNIDVTPARSGSEGVKMLIKDDYDVCILDLKMADIYGLEVLKMFRIMSPTMPVIMLTGHSSHSAAKKSLQLGAYAYLNKPCELEVLLEKISDAYNITRRISA